jgi:hypothetical protein
MAEGGGRGASRSAERQGGCGNAAMAGGPASFAGGGGEDTECALQ